MRLKYILIPVDLAFSAVVERELAMALRLLDDDGKIDMLYVEDARAHHSMVPTVSSDTFGGYAQTHREALQLMLTNLVPEPHRGRCVIRNGVVADEIVAQARESKVDAIVMASAKPKFRSYLLGSNAARVVRHAPCSVLVAR